MSLPRPTRRTILTLIGVTIASLTIDLLSGAFSIVRTVDDEQRTIRSVPLPPPRRGGSASVEEAISARRSRREYGRSNLERWQLGQLLWAAQGVTDRDAGLRAAPSAGALYPLELYAVVGVGVGNVDPGVYRYRPDTHALAMLRTGDRRSALRAAALDQRAIDRAALDVVICAADERTTPKYGSRGADRYVPMEAGHAAENVYLQAEVLTLSTVSIGSFDDDAVRRTVGAPSDQRPLYVLPVGARAGTEER